MIVTLIALIALLALAAPASAAVIEVGEANDPAPTAAHCADATPGDCSLREAVMLANATTAADEVRLPGGSTTTLQVSGAGTGSAAQGDLDIAEDLTIAGTSTGTGLATIDGADLDRVFDVAASTTATLNRLRIQNGSVNGADGGGVRTQGTLELSGSQVADSVSAYDGSNGGNGGGVAVATGGSATISDSLLEDNLASSGGGLVAYGPSATTVLRSLLDENLATHAGAGITYFGPLTLADSTVTRSAVSGPGFGNGGAAVVGDGGSASILRSTIVANPEAGFGNGLRILSDASMSFEGSILDASCADDSTLGSFSSNGGNVGLDGPTDACGLAAGEQAPSLGLGPFQANGGPTRTYAPVDGSPAVDALSDCGPDTLPPLDQRSFPRPGEGCDAGAMEQQSDLTVVSFAGPATGTPGQDLSYTAVVRNDGPNAAPQPGLRFAYPPGLTPHSASPPGICSPLNPVSCSPGPLAPGESAQVTVTFRASAAGSFAVGLSLTSTQGDADQADNQDTVVTEVGVPSGPAPTPSPPGQGAPGTSTRPVVDRVSMLRTRFRVGGAPTPLVRLSARPRRGTAFRFTLSEAARVSIRIERALPGRRSGRRCLKPTRANRRLPRCTRYALAGTLVRSGRAGRNSVAFTGRLGRRALRAGRHRAALIAVAGGRVSSPRRVSFTVIAG